MAIYSIKTCRNCGDSIRIRDDEGFHLESPLTRCRNCGVWLVDSSKKEYIMFTKKDYVKYYIAKTLPGLAVGFFLGMFSVFVIESLVAWLISCLIITILYLLFVVQKNFNDEKMSSIRRCQKIDYLNQLLEFKLITKQQYDDFRSLYNVQSKNE